MRSFAHRESADGQNGEPIDFVDVTQSILVLSDPEACNENFSIYIKFVIENLYLAQPHRPSFHLVSRHALRFLKLNLYTRNYEFCTAKMLAFLSTFASMDAPIANPRLDQEQSAIKEFLCIALLLLLRLKNSVSEPEFECSLAEDLSIVCPNRLYKCLKEHDFIRVIADFISVTAVEARKGIIDHVLLKLSGEILFEYLLCKTSLDDFELQCLSHETCLIPVLILSILGCDENNTYRVDRDDAADEMKLIAYEEFKILLLINEQYLMLHYVGGKQTNVVFEVLLQAGEDSHTLPITHFLNALIYNLNKEESLIIKTLILKFLYQVFTTSFTSKLVYMNDLKILVDVVLRELSNLEYHEDNAYVFVAYLKVLFPLLLFSQLNEAGCQYKKKEILRVIRSIAIGMSEEPLILELAIRCLSVPWINERVPRDSEIDLSVSSRPLLIQDTETKSLSNKYLGSSSIKAVSLNRSNSRKDFNKHESTQKKPTQQDGHKSVTSETLVINNKNTGTVKRADELVKEFLPPQTPEDRNVDQQNQFYMHADSSSLLIGSGSRLQRKAFAKKAPPPPSSVTNSPKLDNTPPPPPPPRRRRY